MSDDILPVKNLPTAKKLSGVLDKKNMPVTNPEFQPKVDTNEIVSYNIYENNFGNYSNQFVITDPTKGEYGGDFYRFVDNKTFNNKRLSGYVGLAGELALMFTGGGKLAKTVVMTGRGVLKGSEAALDEQGAYKSIVTGLLYGAPILPTKTSYHTYYDDFFHHTTNPFLKKYAEIGHRVHDIADKFTPGVKGANFEFQFYMANIISKKETDIGKSILYSGPKSLYKKIKGHPDNAEINENGLTYNQVLVDKSAKAVTISRINPAGAENIDTVVPESQRRQIVLLPQPKAKITQLTEDDIKRGTLATGQVITPDQILTFWDRQTKNPWVREFKRIMDPELDLAISNAAAKIMIKKDEEETGKVEGFFKWMFGGFVNAGIRASQSKISVKDKSTEKLVKFLDNLEQSGGKWKVVGGVIQITPPTTFYKNGEVEYAIGTQGWQERMILNGNKDAERKWASRDYTQAMVNKTLQRQQKILNTIKPVMNAKPSMVVDPATGKQILVKPHTPNWLTQEMNKRNGASQVKTLPEVVIVSKRKTSKTSKK